jgi:ATP-dependent Clp protease ATP-binding subunit ClpA
VKTTPSLELALQLAAQEALAAAFTEIEPEHLLMGLLKFAELPLPAAPVGDDEQAPLRQVLADGEILRARLRSRHIDGTMLRRTLRSRLGRHGGLVGSEKLRRSPASRRLFDEAAVLAHADGAHGTTAVHLLDAVLAGPTPLIRELVQAEDKSAAKGAGGDGSLARLGRDLFQHAAAGQLADGKHRPAEARAMKRVLGGPRPRSVLGICPSLDVAMSAVFALAVDLQALAAGAELAGNRFIDVSHMLMTDRSPADLSEGLRESLLEAADAADVIVVLALVSEGRLPPGEAWPIVQNALLETNLRTIVLATPDVYQQVIAPDRRWLRRMQAMWMRADTHQVIPKEL